MALQSASKAPRQLGYLCSHSWSRACGGHSAVYTAAIQPQVTLHMLLIYSHTWSCLTSEDSYLPGFLVVLHGLACTLSGRPKHAQMSANLECQSCLSWRLSDVCRLAMSLFSSLSTSFGIKSQTKHVGSKTSSLQQVSVMQQSLMRNSQ